jgi:hypothetical protein
MIGLLAVWRTLKLMKPLRRHPSIGKFFLRQIRPDVIVVHRKNETISLANP